jgi:parallel beta-helix repeat protein
MNSKTVSGIMLTLLLVNMLTLAFSIQPAKASGTIYVRADGSVEPDTALISSVDNVTYTFTDNIYDTIIIEKSNVTLDGNGYILQGSGGGEGFTLSSVNNVTIINTNINNYHYGVYLSSSDNNTISNNTITNNDDDGVYLYSSSGGNTFSNNVITSNGHGVYLSSYSDDNTFSNNTITSNDAGGVRLNYASGNTFSNNIITSNDAGIRLNLASDNNTISNNTITNNDDGVHLGSSSGNTISNNTITNNFYDGVHLYSFSGNTISNNTITNNEYGVRLRISSGNTISNNTITNNEYGVRLSYASDNNTIFGNNIANNFDGVLLDFFLDYNNIHENNITDNDTGIRLAYLSDYNTISGNNITNNWEGIWLDMSSHNTISGNNITNNSLRGILLYSSSGNIIFHNNFTDNTEQVLSYDSTNVWDDYYPSGGNYWSDYEERYPGAIELDGSGLWNTPYYIDENNQDNYPLMEPWIATIEASIDIDPGTLNLRSQGRWITVYIELPEDYSVVDIDVSSIRLNETFSVDPDAPTQIGDYDSDGASDLMVKLNRTELTSYLYNILEVKLDTVTLTISGQLTDGTLFEGSDIVRTRLAGDVNEDWVVDVIDLSMVGRSFGARMDEDAYEGKLDLTSDGVIDIRDLMLIGINYGATIPE